MKGAFMNLVARIRQLLSDYDSGNDYVLDVHATDHQQICATVAIKTRSSGNAHSAAVEGARLLQANGFCLLYHPFKESPFESRFIVCR